MLHPNKIELYPSVGGRLDYLIDGRSLVVHLRSRGRKETDFISPFGVTNRAFESRVASWLLLKSQSDLPSGRVPLLFCPRCCDLGCGAVTVLIERVDDCLVWKDFGFETHSSESLDLTRFGHSRGFAFAEYDYANALKKYLAE